MIIAKIKNRLRIYFNFLKEFLLSRVKTASSVEEALLKYYSDTVKSESFYETRHKQIIYMADGKLKHGGLADRLRGIVTIYDYCKNNDIDFKIHFVSPFQLQDFLEPAHYDWTINPGNIIYDTNLSHPVFLDTYPWNTKIEKIYERHALRKQLKKPYRQLHVYSNYFCAEDKFGELFHELFLPSKTLQHYLDQELVKVNGDYISISTRFLNLLGDFNETFQCQTNLTPEDKKNLVEACIHGIKRIQQENTGKRVLVTSDSSTFLTKVKEQVSCHIINGNISHIDADNADNSATLKTFLDFFMIAKASKSYLILGEGMLNSNFSKRAAALNNHEFIVVTV